MNSLANAIDNKDEIKKRSEAGKTALRDLQTCVENCQNRFGGRSELATEDDIRYIIQNFIYFLHIFFSLKIYYI